MGNNGNGNGNKKAFYGQLFLSIPKMGNENYNQWYRRIAESSGIAFKTVKCAYERHFKKNDPNANKGKGVVSVSENREDVSTITDRKTWDESKNTATWEYNGLASIHTLEDAISYSKVDMSVWEVERHVFNSWEVTMRDADKNPIKRTNVQVKVWFVKRVDHGIDWEKEFGRVRKELRNYKVSNIKGSGVGFVGASDFHFGAYVDDLLRSDRFNITVLSDYLKRGADIVNQKGYDEVHIGLLGDFIESFTGLNHNNSWKGLGKGMFGMNSAIMCYEILMEAFISRINNVKGVYLVSGNHDRVTSHKEGDEKGEVGRLLHYLIDRELSKQNVEVLYHPMLISKVIDGVNYLMTHGHLPLAQKEISKALFDHGKQGVYNVFLQGHVHSRGVTKGNRRKQYEWNDVKVVQLDEVDYRAITLPPLFTGNFFSESLGFSSSAGMSILENNGRGRINYFDHCL